MSAPPGRPLRRIAVVGSASGSGKTTLARALAARLSAPFIDVDAHFHGPGWTRPSDQAFRDGLVPLLAGDRWTIDGLAERQVGRAVIDRVDLVVWLDLPPWVWLPRLLRRSASRALGLEVLPHGNRETLKGIFLEREGLLPHAFRAYFLRRRGLTERLARHVWQGDLRLIRLCQVSEVKDLLVALQPPAEAAAQQA